MIGMDWETLWFGVATVAAGLVVLGVALVRSAR